MNKFNYGLITEKDYYQMYTGLKIGKGYISRIVEENRYLKDVLEKYRKEYKRKNEQYEFLRHLKCSELEQETKYLKERIDKAIEYIENHCLIIMNKEYIPDGIINCIDIKLLEILKGDSNE